MTQDTPPILTRLARLMLSLREFSQLTSLGRTRVFDEIKSGRLKPVRCGRRTLITLEEYQAWVDRLKAEGGDE